MSDKSWKVRNAGFEDASAIFNLIRAHPQELVPRSMSDIIQNVDRFLVAEAGGRVIGTVSWGIPMRFSARSTRGRTLRALPLPATGFTSRSSLSPEPIGTHFDVARRPASGLCHAGPPHHIRSGTPMPRRRSSPSLRSLAKRATVRRRASLFPASSSFSTGALW